MSRNLVELVRRHHAQQARIGSRPRSPRSRSSTRANTCRTIRSRWVDERRSELADRARDARNEVAELAFAAGRYQEAKGLLAEVLDGDPYREAVWRLNMRIANALSDDDGVIRAYRGCERALADLGTEPAPATRALLERMRR